MPMRQECKHFESRTYANGDAVRKCDLDLAPDAPWRCPENCPKYERRLAAVAWTQGTLVAPPTPEEPASVADGTAAALLDEAEDYLNSVGDRVRAEVDAERSQEARVASTLRPAVTVEGPSGPPNFSYGDSRIPSSWLRSMTSCSRRRPRRSGGTAASPTST